MGLHTLEEVPHIPAVEVFHILEVKGLHSPGAQGFHILEGHVRSLQALGAEGLRNHANGRYSLPEAAFQDGAIVSDRYVGRQTSTAAPGVPIQRSSQAEEAGDRDLDASTGTTFLFILLPLELF